MNADQFVKALRAEGLSVAEYPGWRTNNRNHKGAWGPVNGVVIHHTAGTNSKNLVFKGTSTLPGPLCHSHLAKDGTVTMVGNGRANHAGTFAANAFNAMLNESKTHPRPDSSEPIDANARTYGLEIENLGNGKDYYPHIQYNAAVRWAAAICRFHGWSAESVIGHAEGTRRKIDPKGPVGSAKGDQWDMDQFRKDVQYQLDGKPAEPVKAPSKARVITVKAGQTLGVIAASVGLSVAALLGTNPHITDPDVIHPGDKVTVPATPPASTSKPKPKPSASKPAPKPKPKPKASAPKFPGTKYFRPGATNKYVTALGKALVKKGYGRFYRVGPGPRWSEADRKAVQAFQRAQGWSGSGADGYPGPQTWARLMK